MDLDDRPWLDILERKHECGPSLAPHVIIDVPTEDGRGTLKLSVPQRRGVPERLEIKAVLGSGPVIAVIGRLPADDVFPEDLAPLMVARQSEDGTYVVHVWHLLFGWALKYLGLADQGAEGS